METTTATLALANLGLTVELARVMHMKGVITERELFELLGRVVENMPEDQRQPVANILEHSFRVQPAQA